MDRLPDSVPWVEVYHITVLKVHELSSVIIIICINLHYLIIIDTP
jgi:hypothetical protein